MEKRDLEKEFLDMVRQYGRIIYKVSSFYIDEKTSLEDMYQEIVLNLWKSYPSFRGESIHSTWIYRVALNTCVSYYRKEKRRPSFVDITYVAEKDDSENSDIVRELYALINGLGKMERALVLLYLEDRPQKEIAEIMGMTVTNVSTRLARIKEKLKQMSNH
ncbi:MAG: sigma-70 family RNA polymerase sigma factor [Dysgonamonadaceae bacterium]|jgi:RNA polymerase sigma-70 factor (ECF subfamily)|nr:sigma-70 family RNA polymerase sigma factor [Dysgonamonadaceae bacterium]